MTTILLLTPKSLETLTASWITVVTPTTLLYAVTSVTSFADCYQLAIFTQPEIMTGEQPTANYGESWWNERRHVREKNLKCNCKANVCRYSTRDHNIDNVE